MNLFTLGMLIVGKALSGRAPASRPTPRPSGAPGTWVAVLPEDVRRFLALHPKALPAENVLAVLEEKFPHMLEDGQNICQGLRDRHPRARIFVVFSDSE